MLKKDSNYKRLKLGGRSWLNQATYWIGPNHLLVVEVSNYVERYRRFYFRDVQAILVQNSAGRLGWNIGFGVFASLLLAGLLIEGLSATRDDVLVTIWFFFFFLFVVCLIINTLRGPSCTVHLRTAVQNQRLSGISRWRKANALVAAITPLIAAAQTSLPTTEPPDAAVANSQGLNVAGPDAPPRTVS